MFVVVAGVLGLVVLRPESHCACSGGPDLGPILLVFGLLCSLNPHPPPCDYTHIRIVVAIVRQPRRPL